MQHKTDLTKGNSTVCLAGLFLPMLAANILQQAYTTADMMIVGKGLGDAALASVGNLAAMLQLVNGFVMGMTGGFSVNTAWQAGTGSGAEVKKVIGQAMRLTMIMSEMLVCLSVAALYPIMMAVNCPKAILADCMRYGMVIFAGIPLNAGYNMLSGILRAMGDGRTPLVAVTAASFINIALDCLMIFGMHTGVAGAAVATVIAQGTAARICLKKLKKLGAYAAEGRTRDSRTRAALLKNGFPQAFMHTVTAAGCLVVQGAVNGLGVGAAAAYSVCGKYLNLFMLPSLTAGLAVSVFAGQNAGAGKADRIRSGVRAGSGIAAFAWFAAGGAMCLFSRRLAMLMISGEEAVSLSAGYLEICGTGLILLNLLFVFRGCVQGMGKPVVPMCSGIAEMAVRIGVIAVFAKRLGFVSVGIAEIAAWACALLMNMAGYVVAIRKMGK